MFIAVLLAMPVWAQDAPEGETDSAEETDESVDEPTTDEDFIPTEEIPADKEVTFPADI